MILMAVGDDKSLHFGRIVLQISDIRDYKIDSQHVILRECQTTVHHNNTVFVLKGSNIHTDLFQTAQRYDTQFSVFLFFQILKHLHFNYVFPPFLYDSDRTSLTSGHKKNSSFVNCPLKKELCLFPPAFSA